MAGSVDEDVKDPNDTTNAGHTTSTDTGNEETPLTDNEMGTMATVNEDEPSNSGEALAAAGDEAEGSGSEDALMHAVDSLDDHIRSIERLLPDLPVMDIDSDGNLGERDSIDDILNLPFPMTKENLIEFVKANRAAIIALKEKMKKNQLETNQQIEESHNNLKELQNRLANFLYSLGLIKDPKVS